MDAGPFAHSAGREGYPEPLAEHLSRVAAAAALRADQLGWSELARVAGQLHDIGKASIQFQHYLQGAASRGGDHSTAGAIEAQQAYPEPYARLLALIIAGHHSGLADPGEIERRLASAPPNYDNWEAYSGPLPSVRSLAPTRRIPGTSCPGFKRSLASRF